MAINEKIIEKIKSSYESSYILRNGLVGAVVDTDRLAEISFHNLLIDSTEFSVWKRTWNKEKFKVIMVVHSSGTIFHMNILQNFDIQIDDYLGAPQIYGWHFTNNCSTKTQNLLLKDIKSILKEPIQADGHKAFHAVISLLDFVKKNPMEADEYVMCCHALYVKKSNPSIALFLASILSRHINEIKNTDVLSDLPFLLGRIGLIPECVKSIKFVLQKKIELAATNMCNIAAVLTDNVQSHEASLVFFIESIKMDAYLPQPRQGIWHAGKRAMFKCIVQRRFEDAIRIADEVLSKGSMQYAVSRFFAYQGIVEEKMNNTEKAKMAYENALSVDSSCFIAKDGKDRISGSKDSLALWMIIDRLIESLAFSDYVQADRYPIY